MDLVVVTDGAIAAAAGIITGGAEAVGTIMVGGIIAATGDLIRFLLRSAHQCGLSFRVVVSIEGRLATTPAGNSTRGNKIIDFGGRASPGALLWRPRLQWITAVTAPHLRST
jgi:hypothetical protein